MKNLKSFLRSSRFHKALFVIFVVIVPILIVIARNTSSKSVERKLNSSIEQISIVNNTAGNIPDANNLSENADLSKVIADYDQLLQAVNANQLENSNLVESVLQPTQSSSLKAVKEEYIKLKETTITSVNNLKQQLSTLEKFLNYDPVSDFATLGQDAMVDAERIERARTAINLLLDNGSLQAHDQSLTKALNAFDSFEKDKNLDNLDKAITASQVQSLTYNGEQNNLIKQSISNFYNQTLYQ